MIPQNPFDLEPDHTQAADDLERAAACLRAGQYDDAALHIQAALRHMGIRKAGEAPDTLAAALLETMNPGDRALALTAFEDVLNAAAASGLPLPTAQAKAAAELAALPGTFVLPPAEVIYALFGQRWAICHLLGEEAFKVARRLAAETGSPMEVVIREALGLFAQHFESGDETQPDGGN